MVSVEVTLVERRLPFYLDNSAFRVPYAWCSLYLYLTNLFFLCRVLLLHIFRFVVRWNSVPFYQVNIFSFFLGVALRLLCTGVSLSVCFLWEGCALCPGFIPCNCVKFSCSFVLPMVISGLGSASFCQSRCFKPGSRNIV